MQESSCPFQSPAKCRPACAHIAARKTRMPGLQIRAARSPQSHGSDAVRGSFLQEDERQTGHGT